MMLPPLTLQMLIENAVKHNVASDENPLVISVSDEGSNVVVWNSLNPKLDIEPSGTGLQNIKDRITHFSSMELVIEKTNKDFKVTVPLIEIETI